MAFLFLVFYFENRKQQKMVHPIWFYFQLIRPNNRINAYICPSNMNLIEVMKENKYDDDRFFSQYAQMSRSVEGLQGDNLTGII